ncbi:MAG: bifunctional phosphopantothenoylcysteine decarboxylase/phosphopantothenate--cysteine ligase CoaBC [Eggerthellaceae bacterium]|nr:bifunctional phosphopantothenoylcysteine decarboxylase/phosphopantothenate--cysteine ligase CoaBC [Eggerthellaceae bacterium]
MKNQKTVLLGITGCIAAYKACEVVRLLQKAGIRVKVVMTEHATEFVGPTTFRALTHEKVAVGLFDDPEDPIHHISLAEEADLFLIAPCTANVMAKVACGIADDLLTTTALATQAPLLIAPAMNVHMYENRVTQENMERLRERGVKFVEAGEGYLACGDVGRGRLVEPVEIADSVLCELGMHGDMKGISLLITAGPTIEPIDPVRYITNFSSGKTGYSLAQAASRRGADVTIVSGPVAVDAPVGVNVIRVQTARQMYDACCEVFPDVDIAIFAAAVADMRPKDIAENKLKKGLDSEALKAIELAENPDILATLGKAKTHQVVIGFAAETRDVIENARKKLYAKNADMIIANKVGNGLAFGTDGNEIWLVRDEGEEHVPFMMKPELANIVLDKTLEIMK